MDANLTFTLEAMKATHRAVKMHYLARFRVGAPNLMRAASVTFSELAGRRHYFVEVHTKEIKRFVWEGRAFNAYEARDRAWQAWLRMAEGLDEIAKLHEARTH